MGSFLAYLQRTVTNRLLREEGRGSHGKGRGERRLPDKADFFFFLQMLLAEEQGGSSMFSYISQG